MIEAQELADYRKAKAILAKNAACMKRYRDNRLATFRQRARNEYWQDPEKHRARSRSSDKHIKNLLERDRRLADPRANMLRAAKERAKKHGIAFGLTIDDIAVPDYCPALGLRLTVGEGKQCDASPSLDRLDSSKGYVPGNVWVISLKANRIKTNATANEIRRVADALDALANKGN